MRIECPCGFAGSIREQQTPLGVFARCFGCDTLYDQKGNAVTGIPEFKNFADMQKYLDKMNEGKSKPSSSTPSTGKKKPRSRKKIPAEADTSGKLIEETPKVPIYKTIHFYLRPGDSWPELLKDGRQEVEMSGPGTYVFCHNHFHDGACGDSCRRMV